MNNALIYTIKNLIVPIVVGFGSSYLGLWWNNRQETKKNQLERLKEKYCNFYLPFVELYDSNIFGAVNFTDLSEELQEKFSLILIKNDLRYSDRKLSNLIYEYKACFTNSTSPDSLTLMVTSGSKPSVLSDLNNTFNKVYDYIFDLYYSAKNELGY